MDHLFRTEAGERTSTAFESKEQWEDLQRRKGGEWALERLRKNKKIHFWMNAGTVKLSTIHSFKGWEIDTLVLLIEGGTDPQNASDDELIYTAITRCRKNLLVLNLGNPRYHGFFEGQIGSG